MSTSAPPRPPILTPSVVSAESESEDIPVDWSEPLPPEPLTPTSRAVPEVTVDLGEWAEPGPPVLTPVPAIEPFIPVLDQAHVVEEAVALLEPEAELEALTSELDFEEVSSEDVIPHVPVVHFGGAAQGSKVRAAPKLSAEGQQLLQAIERLAHGEPALIESEKILPARMVASLIRLLLRKGLIDELEFLEELSRK